MKRDIPIFEGPDILAIQALAREYMPRASGRGLEFFDHFRDNVAILPLPRDTFVNYLVPRVCQVAMSGEVLNIDMTVMVTNQGFEGIALPARPTTIGLQLSDPFKDRTPHHLITLWREAGSDYYDLFASYQKAAEWLGTDLFGLSHILDDMVDRSREADFWEEGAWLDMTGRPFQFETVGS